MLSYFSSVKIILNKFLFYVLLFTISRSALAAETPIRHVVSLSRLGLFQQSDMVVKIVMIIMGILLIACWIFWLVKTYKLIIHKLNIINSIQYIQKSITINEHFKIKDPATEIVQKLFIMSIKSKIFILERRVKDRVVFQIERIFKNEKPHLSQSCNFLATRFSRTIYRLIYQKFILVALKFKVYQ